MFHECWLNATYPGWVDRIVTRCDEDGRVWVESPDFPGCFASGDTEIEAWDHFLEAAILWHAETKPAGR